MAIYHATVKAFSRGKGHSATAAAAYRAGLDIVDTGARTVHRFSRRSGVAAHFQLAPAGSPAWCSDPNVFWDAAEAWELRANARVGREVETSLPSELSAEQRQALAIDLGQAMVDRYKVVVLVAIHLPGKFSDARNHHAHLLLSPREVGPEGFGARACAEFDARGGAGADAVREVREIVATVINRHLKANGVKTKVDHRRLDVQALAAAATGDYRAAIELTRAPKRRITKDEFVADWKSQKAATGGTGPIVLAMKEGRLLPTPESHSNMAASAERKREARAGNTPVRKKAGSRRGAGPAASVIPRIARSQGHSAEVLNAQAELIEDWLRMIAEDARRACELAINAEEGSSPLMREALVAIGTNIYSGSRPGFRLSAERLAQSMRIYAAAIERPRLNREAVRQAEDAAREAERQASAGEKSERHHRRAREQLGAARQLLMRDALGRDQDTINSARATLFCDLQAFKRLIEEKRPLAPEDDAQVSRPSHVHARAVRAPSAQRAPRLSI